MIPIVEIIRLEEDHDHGTFGVLKLNKQFFCVTLEPADNENKQSISSVPVQQYICERVNSQKYGDTFEIKNVPGRSHVLFHAGNIARHTRGCVLLAQYVGKLRGKKAVLNSGATFKAFMQKLKGYDSFHLTIKEQY